jgi:energy-coupling factor transporter transmembrane protein EcfT
MFLVLINSKDVEIRKNENLYNIFSDKSLPCIIHSNLNFNSEVNQDYNKYCSLTSEEFNDFYKNNKKCSNCDIPATSERAKEYVDALFKDILNNHNNTDNSSSIELGKAFNVGENITALTNNYILKYPKYIFLLIFWILIFLLFFFFLICYIFKLFCFVPRNIKTKQIWILVIIIIFCTAIFILSLVAYIQNNDAFQGFYNVVCGISKIKEHLLEGDGYQKGASWIGVKKIQKIISNSRDKIIFIKEKVNYNFPSVEYLTNLNTNEYRVNNPIPQRNTIKSLVDYTYFYEMIDQFKSYLSLQNKLRNYLDNIKQEEDYNELNKKVENASEFFNETIKYYDSINITLNKGLFSRMEDILKEFTIVRIVLFWLTLVLSLFGVITMILYIYKEIKINIKFAWILFYIFMLLSLVISFLFGFTGSYTKDLIYGTTSYIDKNVTTNENNTFIYHNVSNILIDKCLKGNGEISLDKYEIFKKIKDYYNLRKVINDSLKLFDDIYNNVDEIINNKSINYYMNDLYYIIRNQTRELDGFFWLLRTLTDASVAYSQIKGYYDAFTSSKDKCPEGYTYLNVSESLNKKDGGKYCFIIDEWTKEEARSRYEFEGSRDIPSKIEDMFNSYNSFLESYKNIINRNLLDNENNFKNFNKTHSENMLEIKDNLLEDLDFSQIFEGKIKDNESVFQLTNCEFIQRDVYKVFQEGYFSFAMKLTTVSIIHLFIGILEMLLFIIYYILFANITRDEKEVKLLTKMNNEICGPLV